MIFCNARNSKEGLNRACICDYWSNFHVHKKQPKARNIRVVLGTVYSAELCGTLDIDEPNSVYLGIKRMKNGVFWDVRPRGSCKNRRFGGISASIIRVTRIV
jgi:hypothetical protein